MTKEINQPNKGGGVNNDYAKFLIIISISIFACCVSGGVVAAALRPRPPASPEPVLAPAEASKQLFGTNEDRYRVYEFTDPVTYRRYLVFYTYRGVHAIEAPILTNALEKIP